jgi:uncharacterized protein YbjT (DUF2867 family)
MTTLLLGQAGITCRRVAERLARGGHAEVESIFATLETGSTAAPVAAERGARRIVLLSRRGDDAALAVERAVRECGAEWTILRASLLDQCFSEGSLLQPVRRGRLALPLPPVGEPFVDADDVAAVAVAALTERGHSGRVYELTGPRLLTFAEAVEEIAAAARRPVRYARIAPERPTSLPAEEIAWLRDALDGRNAHLADGVRRALGREPRDFADYARDTAASGIWRDPTPERRDSNERAPAV